MSDTGNPQILLRLPDSIGPQLLGEASKQDCTVQSLILQILHEHYGVLDRFDPPKRGRPRITPGDD